MFKWGYLKMKLIKGNFEEGLKIKEMRKIVRILWKRCTLSYYPNNDSRAVIGKRMCYKKNKIL